MEQYSRTGIWTVKNIGRLGPSCLYRFLNLFRWIISLESLYPHIVTDLSKTDNSRLIEAEMLALKIIATQPENPDALNGLGLILMEKADHTKAAGYFSQALELVPEREDFLSNLLRALAEAARTAVEAGTPETAMAHLQKSLMM